jgi:RNA-dependent RNA polymerase
MHSDPGTTWRAPRPSRPPRSSRDHAIQRPLSRRPGQQLRTVTGDLSHQPQVPDLKQVYEWSRFPELTVRLRNLSPHTTTYDIYRNFKMHGTIVLIEIYQGRSGTRDGGGKIRFSPPPREAFWAQPGFVNRYAMRMENGHDGYTCIVEFDERNRNRLFKVRSPINKTVEYDEKMKLVPSSLHFGVMLDPEALMTMQTINAMPGDELSLVVDLLRNRLVATFMVDFKDPRSQWVTDYVSSSQISEYDRKNKFMFQIPFTQLKKIYRVDMNNSMIALVVSLDSPPAFFRKKADEKSCHSNENLVWTEFDSWWRQTDVVYDPYRLATAPVALHKEQPVIDIGTYAPGLHLLPC